MKKREALKIKSKDGIINRCVEWKQIVVIWIKII